MEEDRNRTSLEEASSLAANAAHSILRAARAGRDAAGMAAGAAAGGPLGAVLGFVVTRKTFWKVFFAICLSILLLIMVIANFFGILLARFGLLDAEGYVRAARSRERILIQEEIDRLNGIVVDFLFAVRPVNAELRLLNPHEQLQQCLDFCMPELTEKQVEVQLDLMENPPDLMLDSKLFRQVVLNLVQNAEGAMPDGGILWFSTQVKNDRFLLNIADNGTGMDDKTASRIFEPYFTTKAAGTGLGLTMVYKIIKEFAGDIQVQSSLGEGTLFRISLPVPQRECRLLEYK